MASSLRDLEEYDTEVEIPTRIMILDAGPNKKETNKMGLDGIYEADITDYTKMRKYFKKNLRKSYTEV